MSRLRTLRCTGWFFLSTAIACLGNPPVLDFDRPAKPIERGHLDLGGDGPGGRVEVNSYYLERGGKPFFPIVGEFHYCRYPAEHWEEALRRIKAGGVNVVATYVFWNVHERRKGTFDWSGNLDLRRFVHSAQRAGLECIVRVGPFAHGEIRNGGLPDWLYGQAFEVRSNDPRYLAHVGRLYAAIGEQLRGLLYREGGPVIGVQLENEYQHSAAPWEIRYHGAPLEYTVAERDTSVTHAGVSTSEVKNENAGYGRDHMTNLKQIAKRAGLEVPLYTATGWGNAAIVPKGSIPVTAAYPFPFWSKPKPSPFYLFRDLQASPDYSPVSFDTALYPSLPAELGAGISVTYFRRPYVPDESLEPMIVRVLGSGSNGIGYYMYHGGSNPVFETFMNEDTGHGLPKISYDYQAPLGQYGQPKPRFHTLKLLHLFLASHGDRLAPAASFFPEGGQSLTPDNTTVLRHAARAAQGSGFVFLLNYQDHAEPSDLQDLQLQLKAGGRTFPVPSRGTFTLPRGTSAILPVNLDLNGPRLRSATVQPLTVVNARGAERFVFFSIPGLPPELVFAGGAVSEMHGCQHRSLDDGAVAVTGAPDAFFEFKIDGVPVLVVPRDWALRAVAPVGEVLCFVEGLGIQEERGLSVYSTGRTDVSVMLYPGRNVAVGPGAVALEAGAAPLPSLSSHILRFAPVSFRAELQQTAGRRYRVELHGELEGLNDAFLRIDYTGDTAMAFLDGRLVDDHFYSGRTWEIGLRGLLPRLREKELVFVFHPMRADAPYLQDLPPQHRPTFAPGQKSLLLVRGVTVVPEYKAHLEWR